MNVRKKIAAIAAAAVAIGVGSFLAVNAASASRAITASKDKPVLWGCINPSTNGLVGGRFYEYDGSNRYPGCSSWAERVYWSAGNGAPGSDATVPEQSQAVSTVTNWPETSGWAVDNFTRTAVVTRQNEVDASKCGSSAAQCYFYTAQLSDNGTFDAVDGKPAPNTTLGGTITAPADAPVHGSMVGGGKIEFYASSNHPDGSTVPAVQNGKGSFGTTDWVKQFFSSHTQFGTFTFVSYDWIYDAGCSDQMWDDSINPGDDGQGAGDGNITAACPAGN